ncbi:MAG: RidA family protein [Desulfovibrio sp.]|jgi:2-iminobutanoate/2-iminopropanoate deaminase|nr:RidA family protein [Desulfovibrio sp.]
MISGKTLPLLLAATLLVSTASLTFAAGRVVVASPKAPKAIGPYSQGIAAGDFVFTSGQIPLNPDTNKMPEGIEAQARQSLDNVRAVLEAGGSSLDKTVKVTIFLKDLNDFAKVNDIYGTYFTKNTPARSCVQVARIPRDALIEIEAVGVK